MARSTTEWLVEAVTRESTAVVPQWPPSFLAGLRGALGAGITCDQITAMIILQTGVDEAMIVSSGDTIVERAKTLMEIMKGDIDEATARKIRNLRKKDRSCRKRVDVKYRLDKE